MSPRELEEVVERIWRGETLQVRYEFPDGSIDPEIWRHHDAFRVRRHQESHDANAPLSTVEEDWERERVMRWLGEMGHSIVRQEFQTAPKPS